MCFNNRRGIPKLMIPLEIIFQQMSIFLTGTVWNNSIYYIQYMYTYIHTHHTHYIARRLCSKTCWKSVSVLAQSNWRKCSGWKQEVIKLWTSLLRLVFCSQNYSSNATFTAKLGPFHRVLSPTLMAEFG